MSTSSLSIAISALHAHSFAIDTTSHNIANAGTPGYRRERVDLRAAYPRITAIGPMGSGVEAAGISRASDRLADERVRRSSAQLGLYGNRAQIASLAEDVFGEPDRGISTSLDGLFNTFSALSTAPTDSAARQQVISSMQDLVARINDTRSGLEGISTDAVTRLDADVREINSLSARVAEFNSFARLGGGVPADLADDLDVSLDALAEKTGAKAEYQADGRVRLTINGRTLVDADRAVVLTVSDDPLTQGQIMHPTGPIELAGTAGGIQAGITGDLTSMRAKLDAFVAGMVTTMNDLHTTGFTTAGAPGQPLFEEVDGRINLLVTDPAELAASDSATAPLGGAIADQFAQLRTVLGAGYRDVSTFVANAVATLDRSAATAKAVNDGATEIRDSILGVNLDEELTNMLSQQRAYEAAARIITIADDMMATLLAM